MKPAGEPIRVRPLDAGEFARFGDVIEIGNHGGQTINQGRCRRYGDLASLDFDSRGRAGISLFHAELRTLPCRLEMMERHPFGSQAFVPVGGGTFLVVVSADENGQPGRPEAFTAGPHQGVNYFRNIWHGVLAPLTGSGMFAVIDWVGVQRNLVEHWLERPHTIIA